MNPRKLLFGLTLLALFAHGPSASAQQTVNWQTDVEAALRTANQNNQLVLMKFTADWCVYCKKMERETFTRPAVAATVNQSFVPVLVDSDKHKDLVKHLQIKRLPSLLVVSPEMVILKRINGYRTEDKLLPDLSQVIAEHRPNTPPVNVVSQSQPAPPLPTKTASTSENKAAAGPAFGGLCLPSVNETRTLVSGRPDFAVRYNGKTVYFQSAAHQRQFEQSPEKYWPAIDGTCPVTVATGGKPVEGKLEFAAMFRGKLWLSSSADKMKQFVKQPAFYADAARTSLAKSGAPHVQ